MGRPKENLGKRFWSKVNIKGKDECWEWNAYKFPNKYGCFKMNGLSIGAHRVAFVLSGGVVAAEKPYVLHHCDNPSCCNPAHLFAGSPRDNMIDMKNKKRERHVCGEKTWLSKLKEHEVKEIINLRGKVSQRKIARMYGVSYSSIYLIQIRKNWRHVCV